MQAMMGLIAIIKGPQTADKYSGTYKGSNRKSKLRKEESMKLLNMRNLKFI